MKYIFTQVDDYTPSQTTQEFTSDSLNVVLMQFEMFLRGSGFVINGTLDIVPEEEYTNSSGEFIDTYGQPSFQELDALWRQMDLTDHSDYYYDTQRNT